MGTVRKIRTCEGCASLDKRKRKPCPLFDVVCEQGVYIRPRQCKRKFQKRDAKKELARLRDRVVDLFQTYIRYRDGFTCCCCGRHIDSEDPNARKLIHAGHFISRSVRQLLLHDKNVNAQCRDCNGRQNWLGVDPRYCDYMLHKYGEGVFAELAEAMSRPYEEPDWEVLEKHYRELLRKYVPNKGLF